MGNNELIVAFKKLQSGDENGFNEVYSLTEKYVRYVAYSSCHNNDMVEDILQDTYISIYKNCNTVKDLNTVKSWIGTIAKNKARDMLRKDSKTVLLDEEAEGVFDIIEEENELYLPEKAMDNKETQRLLRDIIDRLPEMQKMVMIECEYNELKVREVAELYGIPEGTVKTYRAKAKAFIKEEVEKLYKNHNVKLYAVPMGPMIYMIIRDSIMEMASESMPIGLSEAVKNIRLENKTNISHPKGFGKKKLLFTVTTGTIFSVAILGSVYMKHTSKEEDIREIGMTIQAFEDSCNTHINEDMYACFTEYDRILLEENNVNLARNADEVFRGAFSEEKNNAYIAEVNAHETVEFEVKDITFEKDEAYVLCSYIAKYDGEITESIEGYLHLKDENGWKIDLSQDSKYWIEQPSDFKSCVYTDLLNLEFQITEEERENQY